MLLAGDLGGTSTRLGLFARGRLRPTVVHARTYATQAYQDLDRILDAFADEVGRPLAVAAVAFGLAGPVVGRSGRLTNAAWGVDADAVASRYNTPRVALLNDVEALAHGVGALEETDLLPLQHGTPVPDGNIAVIAAGTGLGQSVLHRVGGRLIPLASEAGHADFAARTDREVDLLRMLRAAHGRAAVEQVVSGPGFLNLHRLTHQGRDCDAVRHLDPAARPAAISQAALERRCPACEEALDLFVGALGAEAGNLALRGLATGGVFVGGGIAPHILPALQGGRFLDAFRAKPPMTGLLAAMPVRVILNPDAGLVGAAVVAERLSQAGGPG